MGQLIGDSNGVQILAWSGIYRRVTCRPRKDKSTQKMCSPVTDGPMGAEWQRRRIHLFNKASGSVPSHMKLFITGAWLVVTSQAPVMQSFTGRKINAEHTVLQHLSDQQQIQNTHSSVNPQVGQDCFHKPPLPNADTLTSIQPKLCHMLVSGCRVARWPRSEHKQHNESNTDAHIQRLPFRKHWSDCP